MVHSAGVGVLKNVEDITVEEWHFVHNVNLHGPFLGIKHGLPRMRAHAPGSIVLISSVSGIIAGHTMTVYNTSKAVASMLAKTTALHFAHRNYDLRRHPETARASCRAKWCKTVYTWVGVG